MGLFIWLFIVCLVVWCAFCVLRLLYRLLVVGFSLCCCCRRFALVSLSMLGLFALLVVVFFWLFSLLFVALVCDAFGCVYLFVMFGCLLWI